jgi:Flp pilus assembly protein, ATPase CpaF
MRDQAELTSWQEKWNQYYDEWGVLKQDHDNEQWAVWENLLLEKFLEWQEKQKARLGVQAENVPEEIQRIHLRRLVQDIKAIPPWAHTELVERFLDDQYRMGPLQKLWEDPEVSDIQVFVPVDPQHKQRITYVKKGPEDGLQRSGLSRLCSRPYLDQQARVAIRASLRPVQGPAGCFGAGRRADSRHCGTCGVFDV